MKANIKINLNNFSVVALGHTSSSKGTTFQIFFFLQFKTEYSQLHYFTAWKAFHSRGQAVSQKCFLLQKQLKGLRIPSMVLSSKTEKWIQGLTGKHSGHCVMTRQVCISFIFQNILEYDSILGAMSLLRSAQPCRDSLLESLEVSICSILQEGDCRWENLALDPNFAI